MGHFPCCCGCPVYASRSYSADSSSPVSDELDTSSYSIVDSALVGSGLATIIAAAAQNSTYLLINLADAIGVGNVFTLSLGQAEDGTGGVGIEATVQHDFACLNISVQEGGAEVRKWSLPIYETGVGPLLITWNDDTKVLCFNNAMSFHLPDATIDRYASWNFANETKILNWEYGAGASDATPGCATCTGTTCDPESPCAADSLGNLTFLDADGNGTDGGVFETSATVPPEGATESQNGASMTLSGYGGDYNGNGSEDGPSGIAIRYFRVTNCTDITIDASATDAALTCTVEQICSAEEISSGSFGVSVSGETGPASLTVTVPPGFYRAITSGIGTGNGSSTVSGSIDEVGPCS